MCSLDWRTHQAEVRPGHELVQERLSRSFAVALATGEPPDEGTVWQSSAGRRFSPSLPAIGGLNVHVRAEGRPNQRYALLFRDYLRAHPYSAQAYETLKSHLAALLPHDSGRYADVKDAGCDLIYFAAEEWARTIGWTSELPSLPESQLGGAHSQDVFAGRIELSSSFDSCQGGA